MTDELERRLRSALTSMADEVPPTDQAWERLQHRLTRQSQRRGPRPVVMALVAAAAAALIAVPVVLVQQASGPADPGGSLPVASSQPEPPPASAQFPGATSGYIPRNGETLVIKPKNLGPDRFTTADNKPVYTFVYVTQEPSGSRQLCFAPAPDGAAINGPDQYIYGDPNCMPLVQPKPGKYEWGRRQGPTDTTKTLWFYVMSRPAAEMLLKTTDDSMPWAKSTRPEEGPDFVLFTVYMPSAKPAKQFTVFDAQRQTLINSE